MPQKLNAEFETFKREFTKWQRLFGLTGYKVYFKYEPLVNSFGDIRINQTDNVVTVRLNSKVPDEDKPYKNIKRTAKHEAIHLLVGRLEQNARWRYSSENEICESTEELVFRLEDLING